MTSLYLFALLPGIFLIFLGSLNICTVSASADGIHQYCATIQASGALGHVSMEISNGVAQYLFNLDVNSLTTSGLTCDYAKGLSFHVHSYWNTGASTSSVAYPTCASSITGLHYDPNFACSSKSQQASTGCVSLNRYSPHYNYTCNSTVFSEQGQYSLCEVGDLTGKFGTIYPKSSSNLQFAITSPWTDPVPPYPYNFDRADLASNMWSSIVFHCKSPSAYLLCAKLSSTDLQSCASDFDVISAYNNPNDDDGSDGQYSSGSLAAGILVSMFSFFFIGMGTLYLLQSRHGVLLVEYSPSQSAPKQPSVVQPSTSMSVVKSELHSSAVDPESQPSHANPVPFDDGIERQSTFM